MLYIQFNSIICLMLITSLNAIILLMKCVTSNIHFGMEYEYMWITFMELLKYNSYFLRRNPATWGYESQQPNNFKYKNNFHALFKRLSSANCHSKTERNYGYMYHQWLTYVIKLSDSLYFLTNFTTVNFLIKLNPLFVLLDLSRPLDCHRQDLYWNTIVLNRSTLFRLAFTHHVTITWPYRKHNFMELAHS